MIHDILSRYHIRYPRSLIYMLQATEYKFADYLGWYRSVRNFTKVENRKQFVGTGKAYLMLFFLWVMIFSVLYLGWRICNPMHSIIGLLYYVLILCALPYALGYLIAIPLLLVQSMQWPVERLIISDAIQRVRKHKAMKIGIAGSYGTTTMLDIVKTIISEGKRISAPPYSYNTLLGISTFVRSLRGDEDVLVFELGEYYPGDIRDLCMVAQPEIGIITGVNEAHLSKFKHIDSTTKTIFELAEYLPDKPVYVNGDNSYARTYSVHTNHILYTTYACGEWVAQDIETSLDGTHMTLVKGEERIEVTSKLLGVHHVGPILVAVDIAGKLGLSNEEIRRGVNNTKPFSHRLEPKYLSEGVVLLDDSYNGNPDGVHAVIQFLDSLKGKRRFYVTPGLVEMGTSAERVHEEIGRKLAEANIEKVLLVRNSVTPHIASGLHDANYKGDIVYFDTGPEAFNALPHLTVPGDVVLIQNDWPDQYR